MGDVNEIELIFDAPKGTRVHNRFDGVTAFSDDYGGPWWHDGIRSWRPFDSRNGSHSSHAPCRTLKAFKRHLRKHWRDLAGCEVVLCSRFVGHNIRAFIPKEGEPVE